MKITVTTSDNLDRLIDKLSPDKVDDVQTRLAKQVGEDMNQYVPLRDGPLRGSMNTTQDEVTWGPLVYAFPQFYGHAGAVVFSNYTTAGTGKRWDLKASGIHMDEWEELVLKEFV